MKRRRFLERIVVGGVGLGASSFAYANIEPEWVEVERVTLALFHLPREFDGYTVAQISDIHMDGWMNTERLRNVVEKVNALQPDLLAITGDFVSYKPKKFVEGLADSLSRLKAKDGVMAVLGNHDHWTSPDTVRYALKRSGITELKNRVTTLRRGKAAFHIAGLDDIWSGEPDLEGVVRQLRGGGACLLLAHEPDYADTSAATGRFDLQISGHSHGGQVRVPFRGPLILPKWGQKYPSGHYRIGTMQLYTNRGLGMVGPHVRFNCRPEITLFTLRSPAAS